ncbi:hypothetical protein Q2T52_24455 [Rhizobium oryzicola]|uniref:Glycoside hydrolase family 5 domain-containing protein n=1 Tax=Rhizobium oryzicola TaxID=1232668 RepID=A0ABT8T3T4_9HYPH|nr:hypothetical protein [Rhizobium oryzicola]MDO1585256.1 hypothetical protein [Rhizobium oryzicola]
MAVADAIPVRWKVGTGNIVTHLTGRPTAPLYEALHWVDARLGRMNSYGWRTVDRIPQVHNFDDAMMEAYKNGITPIILFEYEGSYQTLNPPQPIGSYHDWFRAGVEFSRRFRPNGEWGREHGIRDFGATLYTAINEPDVQNTIPKKAYRDALEGLADGIHSVDAQLKVVPAGFAACNIDGDATLRGYGPVIADLLESGKLDGIDLHTYYNDRWYPLIKGREFSAQSCFDRIKAAMGLKRDINFYSTEFNISRSGSWTDAQVVAKLFLTAFWDNMGIVGANGRPATALAFPWGLPDTPDVDGPGYAMAVAANPWKPEERAKVLQRVLKLAGDMTIVSSDPYHSGTLHLTGADADLFVWNNRRGWTDVKDGRWEITLPAGARKIELWGWDGLRSVHKPSGDRFIFEALPAGETYMALVTR